MDKVCRNRVRDGAREGVRTEGEKKCEKMRK